MQPKLTPRFPCSAALHFAPSASHSSRSWHPPRHLWTEPSEGEDRESVAGAANLGVAAALIGNASGHDRGQSYGYDHDHDGSVAHPAGQRGRRSQIA